MALRNGMRSIVIIYITYNNNIENNNNNLLQLSCHSAVVLTLVQKKQIRINM